MTIGCSACSDIAVHGKTAKPHTEECRNRIGEQVERDLQGHERFQAHKRRRAKAREARNMIMPDVLEPQAKSRARLEPRRSQKREGTTSPRTGGTRHVDISRRLELEC